MKVISHSSGRIQVGNPQANVTATANMLGLTGHIITFPMEAGAVADANEDKIIPRQAIIILMIKAYILYRVFQHCRQF